ncbi:MAG TPA: branched-chain amino acid ABC transporter permease, partial [Methylomirabilota bacterium]|nr:branched-chain amino acid ABC transporter permease [Methylomirabilota bacterium]
VLFIVSLLVDGILAGAVYALIALGFVVVYKASRMINFALGEWAMLGSRLAATGVHALGLGLASAVGVACVGAVGVAVVFNRLVLRRLVGRPLISVIMVTLGLGAFMRGAAPVVFAGIPHAIALPFRTEPIVVHGVLVSSEKLLAATIAAGCVAGVSWFFRRSRAGLALRAIADDQPAALAVGIDVPRHFSLAWGLMGALSVLVGTLWAFVSGGGFGVVLVGLKVFPIVIIGGLDSIPGTIVGAIVIGVLESLAAGYLDPLVGGGFSSIASYLVLIAALFARPYGLFGRPDVERV